MKFIHVTDTHLVPPGERLYELDSAERLRLCIADINRNRADADSWFTGDSLPSRQAPPTVLRECLPELRLPSPPFGNHGPRQLPGGLPEVPRRETVQYTLETAAGLFVCTDTNEPRVSWGILCEKRLAWLQRTLDAAGDRPVYLFQHHPPFPVKLKRMDEIALQQPEGFTRVVAGRTNIRHLFFGHLHRPIGGSWRGIPVTTMRATSHQVALDFVVAGKVPGSHEPPAYAIVFASRTRPSCISTTS
jgi:3',5'-cyclic AMP phosphodiesterase CpdA